MGKVAQSHSIGAPYPGRDRKWELEVRVALEWSLLPHSRPDWTTAVLSLAWYVSVKETDCTGPRVILDSTCETVWWHLAHI